MRVARLDRQGSAGERLRSLPRVKGRKFASHDGALAGCTRTRPHTRRSHSMTIPTANAMHTYSTPIAHLRSSRLPRRSSVPQLRLQEALQTWDVKPLGLRSLMQKRACQTQSRRRRSNMTTQAMRS